MTARKAIGIVLLCGVAFAFIGGLIGAALATTAPGYYRSLFHNGCSPGFNPFQVGIGLGVTQGLALGVVIALGGLAFLAWRELRAGNAGTERRPRSWSQLVLWGLATLIPVVIFSVVAFFLGEIVGQEQLYRAWADKKCHTIAKILDGNEFPNVQTDVSSDGEVFLIGEVKDESKRRALRDKLALAFGTDEADKMIRQVDAGQRSP